MSQGVSVVIPSFNYGRYLAESIESVLSQTHRELEVLVIDDGSTDNTREVVRQFSDPRVRYLFQNNRGLSAARNTGIFNANFPFIAFLDADDFWLPGMLETVLKEFSGLPSDYGMVSCVSSRIDEHGCLIDVDREGDGKRREIRACDIVLKSRFMPSCVVVRREVFGEVGCFDTELKSSEDRDMWIRIGGKYRIHLFLESWVRIRKHTQNMSKNADRMRLNMRKVLAKYFSQTPSVQPIRFLKAFSFHHYELAWMYFDENRAAEAFISLITSLALWPVFCRPGELLDQPRFFRFRSLAHFLLSSVGLPRS